MPLYNSNISWGWPAVILHWLSACMVIFLFLFGLWMVGLDYYHSWYNTAPYLHKSIGITLFMVTIIRLFWRTLEPAPESINSHSAFEIKLARIMHFLIYVLLFCIMFSGYLISTADGRSIEVFKMVEIPAIIYGIEHQEDIAGIIHLSLAIGLIGLVCIHAGAAIKHHFIDKDQTLKRMLIKYH